MYFWFLPPDLSNFLQVAFRILLGNNKKLSVEIKGFQQNPSFINRVEDIPILKILIELGFLLTPATTYLDPRAWFGIIRYLHYFLHNNDYFVVSDEVMFMETRQRALLAEDIGVGICGHILRNYFRVIHISDVRQEIRRQRLRYITGKETPDFFCINKNNRIMITEAKGTFSRSLSSRLLKGKRQVRNIQSTSVNIDERFVIATSLRYVSDCTMSNTVISDPAENKKLIRLDVRKENIIRTSYSKVLNFLFLSGLAMSVYNKKQFEFKYPELKIDGLAIIISPLFYPLEKSIKERFFLGIDKEIVTFLIENPNNIEEINQKLLSFEAKYKYFEEQKKGLVFNNGVILYIPKE